MPILKDFEAFDLGSFVIYPDSGNSREKAGKNIGRLI